MLGSISLLDQESKKLLMCAAPTLPEFYKDAMNHHEIKQDAGCCGTAAFTGKCVIVEDIQHHPYWQTYKQIAREAGLAACWSEPILSADDKVIGTLAIYHRTIYQPTHENLVFIEQTANLASIAIERYNAEQQLQESQERWKFALEGAGDGVWEYHFPTGINRVSKRLLEILGYSATSEFDNQFNDWAEWIHPDSLVPTQSALQAVINNQTDHYIVEQRGRRADGQDVWLLSRGMVVNRTEDGKPVRMIGTSTGRLVEIAKGSFLVIRFKEFGLVD